MCAVMRRLSLLLIAVVTVAAVATGVASARARVKAPAVTTSSPLTRGSSYLALGDSVTFGYQEPTTVPAPIFADAASFPGYPEQIAKQLHVRVTNLACPGETSGSLINARAPSNGCENAYRKAYPLHARYRGSQLAAAVSFLRRHRGVRLVSLMIGANDLFLCQKQTSDSCLGVAEQQRVLTQTSRNVRRILSAIRVQAHYRGQIVILSYYSLNYASPLVNSEVLRLNRALESPAKPFRVVYASGYNEFKAASVKFGKKPCLAGLITQLKETVGNCGVHPTYAGQALLAAALLKALRLS